MINGILFRKFLNEHEEFLQNNIDNKDSLVNEIQKLISTINVNRKNQNKDYIFELIPNDYELYEEIKSDDLSKCVSSIYKTVFERTARLDNGNMKKLNKLPVKFQRGHDFVKIIDSARHEFGGHLTSSSSYVTYESQYSRADLLRLLKGTVNEPNFKEKMKMQTKILEFFVSYLTDLNEHIKQK
jgi:hypothetical protein